MNALETLTLVIRAMKAFDDFRGGSTSDLWWRTDAEYAPVTLFVNCNDVFAWSCADCEEINLDNIHELEKAKEDLGKNAYILLPHLFAARVRKQRPQGAMYRYIPDEVRPLFDACGPERETGFGNPYSQNQTYRSDEYAP